MSRFVSELMHSSDRRKVTGGTDSDLSLLLVALIAYAIPWLVNPGVSLSPNAYDLAEWASIHPAMRLTAPPLLTSFLLRLPLVCLALLFAYYAVYRGTSKWIAILCVLLIAFALLPPLEFFTSPNSDINYQQQVILVIVTLIGGAIAVSGVAQRVYSPLVFICALVGTTACILGLAQGYDLMSYYNVPVRVGMGGVTLSASFLAFALLQLRRFRSTI